ncbi:hypothetical protein FJT64_011175 [Amphibalanus amphitrite]|uniref:Uncharacterized protein n=1 Tax=Amphibalanus amphitrite TaxID=1232801 RepID=A0A6A4VA80_AMPAM|nr:hypothetical protein FJT64_011175 [Amphibalanus amphitrite]
MPLTSLCCCAASAEGLLFGRWQVTEKTWWWFGCVMFIALPLLFATIKHCSRLAEDPKAVSKNKRAIFKLIHGRCDPLTPTDRL